MRRIVIGAILAAVLAACGPPPGVLFQATLTNPGGDYPLPVTLGDTTGLVVGIEAAQIDANDFRNAGILPDPTGEPGFVLTWLGGMCDNDATLAFRRIDSGYDVHLAEHGKLGFGCPAAGILRAVLVRTSEPIALGSITISGSKTIQLIVDEDCGPLRDAETGDAKLACFALLAATIGDGTQEFASVTVAPEGGPCAGTECSTAAGIEARQWRVDATDRKGQEHAWRCTYRDERASCTVVTPPSSP